MTHVPVPLGLGVALVVRPVRDYGRVGLDDGVLHPGVSSGAVSQRRDPDTY
jgi:hypothetical protein